MRSLDPLDATTGGGPVCGLEEAACGSVSVVLPSADCSSNKARAKARWGLAKTHESVGEGHKGCCSSREDSASEHGVTFQEPEAYTPSNQAASPQPSFRPEEAHPKTLAQTRTQANVFNCHLCFWAVKGLPDLLLVLLLLLLVVVVVLLLLLLLLLLRD